MLPAANAVRCTDRSRSEERRVGKECRSRRSPAPQMEDQVRAKLVLLGSSYRMSAAEALSFFFQAEDGIRDKLVTGVQTCALPISPPETSSPRTPRSPRRRPPARRRVATAGGQCCRLQTLSAAPIAADRKSVV